MFGRGVVLGTFSVERSVAYSTEHSVTRVSCICSDLRPFAPTAVFFCVEEFQPPDYSVPETLDGVNRLTFAAPVFLQRREDDDVIGWHIMKD